MFIKFLTELESKTVNDHQTAFVSSFGVFMILALLLPKPKPEPSLEVSSGPNAQGGERDKTRKGGIFPSGTNKVDEFINSARDSYNHITEISGTVSCTFIV